MRLIDRIERFNSTMIKKTQSVGDAAWNYGGDFGVGVLTSFSRFSKKAIRGEPVMNDYIVGVAKIVGGSLVGSLGGGFVGLETGGVSVLLSNFGIISQQQSSNFAVDAFAIGLILGQILGSGLYHASIGRRERHQARDRDRRLQSFQ